MKFHYDGIEIDTDKPPYNSEGFRGLVAAFSGHGKSYTLGLTIEQWLDQGGTVVIFEPIAEWHTLKQRYPIQQVGGPHQQDIPLVETEAELYANAVVEKGISMIFYTRDVRDQEKLVEFVCKLIDQIMRLQEMHHRPLMLVLEEAHEYAPNSPKGQIAPPWVYNRMIKSLTDCYTQGRKLNICPFSATQRPQLLNFTIRQQCNFVWLGKFSPQDANYIDKEVLKSFRERGHTIKGDDLTTLTKGEWYLLAGDKTQRIKITDKRKTPHGADTPKLDYIAPVSGAIKNEITSLGETLREMIKKREEEQSEADKLKRQNKHLNDQLDELNKKLQLGKDLKDLFKPLQAEKGRQKWEENPIEATLRENTDTIQVELNETKNRMNLLEEAYAFACTGLEIKNHVIDALKEDLRDIQPVKDFIIKTIMASSKDLQVVSVGREVYERKPQKQQNPEKPYQSYPRMPPWTKVWVEKLNTTQYKVLAYIAEKAPLELTQSEIALGLGYSPTTGVFKQALRELVKWKLVKKQGKTRNTTYKLTDTPPR